MSDVTEQQWQEMDSEQRMRAMWADPTNPLWFDWSAISASTMLLTEALTATRAGDHERAMVYARLAEVAAHRPGPWWARKRDES